MIDKRNKYGDTPLTLACRLGLYEKVKSLLIQGSNPNELNHNGWNPIMISSKYSYYKQTKLLIKYGANIHYRFNTGKETVLMVASKYSSYKIIKLLLKSGADSDINIQDIHGWTALMIAARNSCLKIVNILLEYGANVNLGNLWGYTPVMLAATRISEDLEDYKDKTLSNEFNDNYNKYIVKLLLKYNCDIDLKNKTGQTVFEIAREYKNNEEVIQILFRRKKKLLRRQCDICGFKVGINEKSLPICGDCRGPTRYCSKECQRQHWNAGHRSICKSLKPKTTCTPVENAVCDLFLSNIGHGVIDTEFRNMITRVKSDPRGFTVGLENEINILDKVIQKK